MRYILLLIIASFTFAGDAVNPVVKTSLDSYESEVSKAYADYLKAVAKVNEKTTKDMDVKLKAAMKKGDLDTANALKVAMDKVAKGKTLSDLENKWKLEAGRDPSDLLTAPGAIQVISATFAANGETIDVTERVQAKFDQPNKKPFVLDAKVFGDPVPGFAKTLTIVYTINGKKSSKTFQSWDTIDQSKF